jgi:peptidoglycan/LPS O-acetylase OafA/YrhL
MSHALYLVHWDVYRIMADLSGKVGLNAAAACVLAVALSLLLAWLVHAAVERPFMALRDRVTPDAPAPVSAQT